MSTREAMNRLIRRGTIINHFGITVELMEDSTAHGCPRVRVIDPGNSTHRVGDEFITTLYQHLLSAGDESKEEISGAV